MRLADYKLGDKPVKLLKDLNLLQTEKCVVKAARNTLALPILIDDKVDGYFLHGSGQLIIDSIIETEKGAIGRPTIKELDKPFLMLGKNEELRNNLSTAGSFELAQLNYSSEEAFVKAADDFCTRLFERRLHCTDLHARDSCVFAFTNTYGFDILVVEKDRLVYTSKEKVFVSRNDKEVLTSPREVVVSKRGKTVVVSKNTVLVEK